jgi:hypothetical protein
MKCCNYLSCNYSQHRYIYLCYHWEASETFMSFILEYHFQLKFQVVVATVSQTSFFNYFRIWLTNYSFTYFSIFLLNSKSHFYYNVLNLLRQIFPWIVRSKSYLPLRDILEFKVSLNWFKIASKVLKKCLFLEVNTYEAPTQTRRQYYRHDDTANNLKDESNWHRHMSDTRQDTFNLKCWFYIG